ncbi:hypothetical protein [Streptomyces chartreusis]|uniref:hypothetical protein n=1 Tax=Streptomyces chartreusis TaxID=1969 RepID=UPI0036454BCF
MLHRRLARDYEVRPASSVAVIHSSMTDVMLHRLTHTSPQPGVTRPPGMRHPGEQERSVRQLLEKIEARQQAERETVERLREQITRLTKQPDAAERTPERL